MKLELSKQKVTEFAKCDRQHYSGLYCLVDKMLLEEDVRHNFYCPKCRCKLGVLP